MDAEARPGQDRIAALRHDLRTPLNHIIGYTEILIEDVRETSAAGALCSLDRILGAGRQILQLVNGVLTPAAETREPELAALRERMQPLLSAILGEIESLSGPGLPAMAADLARIREAAGALLRFTVAGETTPLPCAPEVPTLEPAEPPLPCASAGHLLVVDDNQDNREMLRRRLERQGYQVTAVADGRQAVNLLRHGGFDLVLLDVLMPGLDGIEVLRQIQCDPALRQIPVIMISALDETDSVVKCIEMGAEDYLAKPFDPVLLRARIGASLDKKRLRDQLIVREKLASLGELTAGIAHEIRNPLNFVTNFAELIQDLVQDLRTALPEEAVASVAEILADLDHNAGKIREHGRRAERIVHAMLMHSRGSSGERQAVEINALVTESVNLAYHGLRAQDPSFQAAIETACDPAAGRAGVVPQDISRVFLNIAANAFYAAHQKSRQAPEGFRPTVWVRTAGAAGHVEVIIRDNGDGIPRAARNRIFTPFFTTKPAGTGTGLGLSMAHDIIRAHQGEIRLDSEEGSYTEFRITLPRAAKEEANT